MPKANLPLPLKLSSNLVAYPLTLSSGEVQILLFWRGAQEGTGGLPQEVNTPSDAPVH